MVSDRSEQLGDSGGYRRLYSIAGTYHAYQPKFVALTVDLLLCQLSALSLKSGYEEWGQIQQSYYYVNPSPGYEPPVALVGERFTPSLKCGR
jgi:hypothetical protein